MSNLIKKQKLLKIPLGISEGNNQMEEKISTKQPK